MEKLKRVKIMTPEGEKYITYRPVENINVDQLLCDSECQYGKVCGKIPDPRKPENEEYCFTDFCNSLGEGDGESDKLTLMVPMEGELENIFKDRKDILQIIVGKDPIIKLSEAIEKCCPGMCDMYNSEHTECKLDNRMCIFRNLFLRKTKRSKKEDKDKDNNEKTKA